MAAKGAAELAKALGLELITLQFQAVKSLDEPRVGIDCFKAWFEKFMEPFPRVEGLDGSDWVLAKELTYELFVQVLHQMPRGKAVGAGGLSVELLLLAGPTAWKPFYKALMGDLSNGFTPKNWKRVLYVLLVKPYPNDPDLVSQRRDIAGGGQRWQS